MPAYYHTLERLSMEFTIKDIMVPRERLVSAPDKTTATKRLEENPDFDVIPIEHNGIIHSYIERDSMQPKSIKIEDIVSEGTSILNIVDILEHRRFCFVIVGNKIEGYVHFSDLNNSIVKIPFFVLLDAVESCLASLVSPLINGDCLGLVLDAKRVTEVKKRMGQMEANRANLSWVSILSFSEILGFASHFSLIPLKQEQIDIISKVRNLVCHATNPLVKNHKAVKRLVGAKHICFSILEKM